jgi:Icc-related predicted phosphoesterase
MILIISDTHCRFFTINEQIRHGEDKLGVTISDVIHLGDFGIFKPELKRFFTKEKQSFLKPVHFIEGNHEDFVVLPWIVDKYKTHITHLKRGSIRRIGSYRFLSIGGADYMDAMLTQKGAVITDADIDHCLSIPPANADIIISHDCPLNIGVPSTTGLEYYGETGFKRSDELDAHFKPKLWLFGHHHKCFEYTNENTHYIGLPTAWRGYGLLDNDYSFEFIKNDIPLPVNENFFDRLLKKLKLVRPDVTQS